ncbi:MAG: FG-GAP-like repeat-containing protein [Mariprofundaceae bacterium]|nr:FG-GAP-like repeat-containing protein [Mariprofundaceae bacterium]
MPDPTMPVRAHQVSLPEYTMHNIGSQYIAESRAVRFTDLNQDGFLDVLVGGRKSVDGFHVEWGDGAGHWRVQNGPVTSMQPRDFAVGDVNGDGRLEVLIGGDGDQKGLQIWALDKDNKDWKLLSVPIEAGLFDGLALQDMNHDGWLDIVAVRFDNERDGGVYVLLNDGRGGWSPNMGPMVAGLFTDVAVADINADGAMDIVASRRGGLGARTEGGDWSQTGGVQIWYGDGSARWEPKALPVGADAESVTVADVNGDGRLDVIAGLYQQGIVMWLGKKDGWQRRVISSKGSWGDIRVGDLNSDGKRELVASSKDGRGLAVWHWLSGRFVPKQHLVPAYGVYYGLDLGDVRNDGDLAVAAVRADGGLEIWSGLKAVPEPVKVFQGGKLGEKLSVFYDSGDAALNTKALESLKAWAGNVGSLSGLHYEIEGYADVRPIHSDLYPNNRALSQARAESVVAWLKEKGVPMKASQVHVVGADDPLPVGTDPLSLKLNRRVFVQAYKVERVRLPEVQARDNSNDLFHLDENKVFKTINGVAGYRIGAGDLLALTFWQGGKSTEYKVTVQVDGTVSLPYQAALQVSGLTSREVDEHVTKILERFERKPRVDVLVLKAQSKTVSIFGEVQSLTRQPTGPGTYFLKGKESLVNFLSRAGGPGKDADLTNVQILRDGKTVKLNLDKAIKQGDWKENAILDDGDTIFIPSLAQSKRRVYVLGAVAKPGIVEFIGDINFLDAISKSGGMSKDASLSDIRVLRASRDAPLILPIDFKRFMEKGDLSQNIALQDKDMLIIPNRPITNWNQWIAQMLPTFNAILAPVNLVTQYKTLQLLSKRP